MKDSDMLLAKTDLPPGWIDMGIGEANVILRQIKMPELLPNTDIINTDLKYMTPQGYSPFVQTLERKFGHHCVVSVGAKQGLMASFLAMKKIGKQNILITTPYWTSLPAIAEACGVYLNIQDNYKSLIDILKDPMVRDSSAVLIVSPNNPDGSVTPASVFQQIRYMGVPIIHDAAYESTFYGFSITDYDYDIKIYSAAKQYGVSGARIGWMVVKNTDLIAYVDDAIETLSSSAGVLDQIMVMNIMNGIDDLNLMDTLSAICKIQVDSRRKSFLLRLDDSVFTKESIENNILSSGLFLWLEKKIDISQDMFKVRYIDGKNFGAPNFVRLSIGNMDVLDCFDAAKKFRR